MRRSKSGTRWRAATMTPSPPPTASRRRMCIAGAVSTWAQYTLQVEDRAGFQAALKEKGVPTAVYYPIPLSRQPAYRALSLGAHARQRGPERPCGEPADASLSGAGHPGPHHRRPFSQLRDRVPASASSCRRLSFPHWKGPRVRRDRRSAFKWPAARPRRPATDGRRAMATIRNPIEWSGRAVRLRGACRRGGGPLRRAYARHGPFAGAGDAANHHRRCLAVAARRLFRFRGLSQRRDLPLRHLCHHRAGAGAAGVRLGPVAAAVPAGLGLCHHRAAGRGGPV